MGPRRFLARIAPYAKTDGSRRDNIRLDLNENRFPPAPGVVRALRRLAAGALAMYPESEPLRRELAKFHGLEAENVLLANGGDQAIRWVFETFVEMGNTVVWAAPTFSIYPLSARLRQARIQSVPFTGDFNFPLEKILSLLARKPSLLVLVSPNNPTGTVINDDALRRMLQRSEKTLVLLDEAYGFFSGLDHAAWIREFPSLVILNSFSKAFALAGMRLGYLLGAGEMLKEIEKVALPYPVGSASIQAGLAALSDVKQARQQARRMQQQKKSLIKALEKLDVSCRDTDANFLLARFDDAGAVWEKLRQRGVLVKSLAQEPQLADCLRITVGTRSDHRRLLSALDRILPFQAVLLDMDGVLVDARRSCDEAVLRTVEHFCGRRPRRREWQALRLFAGHNNDWHAAAALLRERGCRVAFTEVKAHFQAIYLGGQDDGLRLREKWLLSATVLEKLRNRFQLGIVTGRPRAEAEWTLKRFGVERCFSVLVGAEDTGSKPKPHPLGIRLALRRLGVQRTLYVGDRVDDMLAARAAGCRAIAIKPMAAANGSAMEQCLQQAGADIFINDINGIMEVLDEKCNDQS